MKYFNFQGQRYLPIQGVDGNTKIPGFAGNPFAPPMQELPQFHPPVNVTYVKREDVWPSHTKNPFRVEFPELEEENEALESLVKETKELGDLAFKIDKNIDMGLYKTFGNFLKIKL